MDTVFQRISRLGIPDIACLITELNTVLRGWMHYFRYAEMRGRLKTNELVTMSPSLL
ncbi:group II intron maturase-specific domain-containing protein [Chitinispirillales bacterium ANBcel5]|uniref:group II intron maturase-specific domain-containing protein n=1 Tax=Cellulosispirillum alkaliphilum TaxID=3039283 RepID=UPI002A53F942|nr:group II intron maturase-specific domain-containing protein [Chitinispirillales bacterium ANBcel5]